MKNLILAVLLTLAASFAGAGTITVSGVSRSTSAANDAAFTARKDVHNRNTCTARGLSASCTQAQLNAVSGCAAGACGTIYEGAQATQNYFLDIVFNQINEVTLQVQAYQEGDARAAWTAATPAQRQAACTALGKDANCQ